MEDQPDDSVLLKPKPKRIKTPAQQAVWDKACALRIANAKLKKDALSNAKAEIENKKKKIAPVVEPPVVIDVPVVKEKVQPVAPPASLAKKKPKVVYESDSESEPEVIVVKKKKKKQIVYEEESSEDDTPPPPPVRKAKPMPVAVAPPARIPIVRFF
jgi:hypothetical protein